MEREQKTVIDTVASRGIGTGVVRACLARGYNVIGSKSDESRSTGHLPGKRPATSSISRRSLMPRPSCSNASSGKRRHRFAWCSSSRAYRWVCPSNSR
jgi:NAD(P)-dependent dehydrogenase (short-subunit alcohol dehydrogenase family)